MILSTNQAVVDGWDPLYTIDLGFMVVFGADK
jgi:hypothetical protein